MAGDRLQPLAHGRDDERQRDSDSIAPAAKNERPKTTPSVVRLRNPSAGALEDERAEQREHDRRRAREHLDRRLRDARERATACRTR